MLGSGEFLQQSRLGSCCTGQSRHGSRGLENAWIIRKADGRCHLTSLGRWAKLADLSTLAKYNVEKVLGGGRCMSKSCQLGFEGAKRRAWCSHGPLGPNMGFLRRSIQGREIQISATVWKLCDGEHSLQSLIPWYIPPLPFSSRQR